MIERIFFEEAVSKVTLVDWPQRLKGTKFDLQVLFSSCLGALVAK